MLLLIHFHFLKAMNGLSINSIGRIIISFKVFSSLSNTLLSLPSSVLSLELSLRMPLERVVSEYDNVREIL